MDGSLMSGFYAKDNTSKRLGSPEANHHVKRTRRVGIRRGIRHGTPTDR